MLANSNDEFIGDKNSRFKVDFLLQLEGIFMNFRANDGFSVFLCMIEMKFGFPMENAFLLFQKSVGKHF